MKIFIFSMTLMLVACGSRQRKESCQDWIPLFNGENLDGWVIKFCGSPLNVNYKNTFRVEDGLLKVNYDEWDSMDKQFGHLFYQKQFSSYKLHVEYRFVGEQVKGGQAWAFKNSGAMLHAQSVESMALNQEFPVSIEAQLLGGRASGNRPTANLCTPGTHVFLKDTLFTTHCINSSSPTFRDDRWINVEFRVYGDSLIQHFVENEKVLEYSKPHIDGKGVPEGFYLEDGTPLTRGYIAFQAESHPIEFRTIELMILN